MSPMAVGGAFGSMVVAYFALGAILAVVNACRGLIVLGHPATLVRRLGAGRKSWAAMQSPSCWASACSMHGCIRFIACAFARSDCTRRRRPRATRETLPDQRPTVTAAADVWYEQAKAAYQNAEGFGPVPMVIVATAGGGIRAAYWTATVLDQLKRNSRTKEVCAPISSPSAAFQEGASAPPLSTPRWRGAREGSARPGRLSVRKDRSSTRISWRRPSRALSSSTRPSSFLPDFGHSDRGAALEQSFEDASGGLLTRPFLSLFPYKRDTAATGRALWRPILLLNATHEETGKRIITGHVLIERNVFIDSLDALHVLGKDMRASTAAHNSARFTYISPAGDLGDQHGSAIDGGYFENYGALSALELARAARLALKKETPGVKLVILMISSDPGLAGFPRAGADQRGARTAGNAW